MELSRTNLTANQRDYAIYLPALNTAFFHPFLANVSEYVGLESKIQRCNYTTPQGAFQYKWNLVSAGHVQLDLNRDVESETFYRKRDKNYMFVLGDSGGFQIAQGVWPAHWANDKCPAAYSYRKRVLEWMDKYCDYGMTLDIPAWIISQPKSTKQKAGVFNFEDTMRATEINNLYWLKERKGDCKILNTLHGERLDESRQWYQHLARFCDPTFTEAHFNGWAFGGTLKTNMPNVLERLVYIVRDNLLQRGKHDWIHILGKSTPLLAVVATALQRSLRKHVNGNLNISFDTSSPVLTGGRFKQIVYHINLFKNTDWSIKTNNTLQNISFANDNVSFVDAFKSHRKISSFMTSPVLADISAHDLTIKRYELHTNAVSVKSLFIIAHNIWCYAYGFQSANDSFDRGDRPKQLSKNSIETLIDEIIYNAESDKSLNLIRENYNQLNVI